MTIIMFRVKIMILLMYKINTCFQLPYSGKLWRWKTFTGEKTLANCYKIRQSLTLQKFTATYGSIANNARDCNILHVITKSLLVFWSTASLWNPSFLSAGAKWVRWARRYHIHVTTHANLRLAVKVMVNLRSSFASWSRLYPLEIANVLPANTLFHLFANSLFCPFAKVFHRQSFPLYSTYKHL